MTLSGPTGVVNIDTASIPPQEQEALAKGCLEFIQRILDQPGGREAIDSWKKTHGLA